MADLQTQASNLVLHGGTALPLALATPISAAADFFASEPWQHRLRELENKHKGVLLLHQRIDAVVRAVGNLGRRR